MSKSKLFFSAAFFLAGFIGNSGLFGGNDPVRMPPQRPNAMHWEPEKTRTESARESLRVVGEVQMAQRQPDNNRRFGPYEALVYDDKILQNVVVKPPEATVYLLLNPAYKDREIQIKISSEPFKNYRRWFAGQNTREDGFVLVSPANSAKAPNELTDWLRTSAPYIEYYMNGELFLHLKRVE